MSVITQYIKRRTNWTELEKITFIQGVQKRVCSKFLCSDRGIKWYRHSYKPVARIFQEGLYHLAPRKATFTAEGTVYFVQNRAIHCISILGTVFAFQEDPLLDFNNINTTCKRNRLFGFSARGITPPEGAPIGGSGCINSQPVLDGNVTAVPRVGRMPRSQHVKEPFANSSKWVVRRWPVAQAKFSANPY